MSDGEYKSGPFKGVKKEEIRIIRNRIKTITGKTPTHKQVMDYYIDEDAFEDSFDMNKESLDLLFNVRAANVLV